MPAPHSAHSARTAPTAPHAPSARDHALAVLRIRGTALAAALLPGGAAVILHVAASTGLAGPGWAPATWAVTAAAVLALAVAGGVAAVIARARPATSPTVPVTRAQAPDLYVLVRELADRLDVPVPSALALTPDCDSWLEDRTHPAQERRMPGSAPVRWLRRRRSQAPPVLVIGSPFLWWMRVAELRALLAPVVAGTGPSAHPDIAAARRCVRGLDAAVAVADRARAGHRRDAGPGPRPAWRAVLRLTGLVARVLLRACGPHAAEMERGVAAAAADRAQHVDRALRTTAQEQVGLAYAGWDRLLTRVALPAWRTGRWPSRLDAGVVAALTELSRRDRLADGFASRLGERPACDLLEEPGAVDASVSLLAARLFHGEPRGEGSGWAPVDWTNYPEEVVDRIWRGEAARLFAALDATEPNGRAGAAEHTPPADADAAARAPSGAGGAAAPTVSYAEAAVGRILERLAAGGTDAVAARISADVARAEAAQDACPTAPGLDEPVLPGAGQPSPMGLPLRPQRSGRELMAEHVTAAVCCAAVDTADAAPGLDWLDGPALLIDGERATDLAGPVLDLVEDGDPGPLRDWLTARGIRADKPVRLV
ncbi:hypothetical protein E4198_13605 [Streptomyces sp. RKND-216]|nr:hypothetical protein E4198_13605 [Streptomyces sp. RKND-216]